MKYRQFCLAALLLLLLAGCSPGPAAPQEDVPPLLPPEPPDLEERQAEFLAFLAEVNGARAALYNDPDPVPFDESWAPDLSELEGQFTEREMEAFLQEPEHGARSVSAAEAAEDVETFFQLLKHAYGAYDYFGGDQVFLPIRDSILAALPEEGEVSPAQLEELLADPLSPVLVDGHLRIGGTAMRDVHDQCMYYVPNLWFDDASGLDPELVKPTVDREGRIRLGLAALASPYDTIGLPLTLEIEGEDVSLWWKCCAPAATDYSAAFSESTLADGTPLLTAMAMHADTETGKEQLERMSSCGGEYADVPVLVWDLRGNRGGSDIYINRWFYGCTGQWPPIRDVVAQKRSPLAMYAILRGGFSSGVEMPASPQWEISGSGGDYLEREGITLVLQDKNTASSGETAVKNMHTLKNSLFLGSNTMGCSLCPNNFPFYLPHSGLLLYMGTGLWLVNEGENIDGVGFLPDLWVPPGEALRAAERLISYYGLNNLPSQ